MVNVRPLKPPDLERYLSLRLALWPDSAEDSSAEVAQMLTDSNVIILVAEENDQLVGFAEVGLRAYAEGCDSSPVGYLEGWYVAPPYRRGGVGRRLVEAAEDWARARGCTEMASDTETHNTQSQQAHIHLGYREVERIVCFRKLL
ncbi:MAG: GNAT family N-acetyltransferase [Meiothermus sp.]|nr:GNAT family N-acetyltransferase [Meiothermus sp.]